jgi:hypothetical protein
MSACGAHVRDAKEVRAETLRAWGLVKKLRKEFRIPSARRLPEAFQVLDLALTHAVYLEAIREYLDRGGKSRGSYVVPDESGPLPCSGLERRWAFTLTAPADFVSGKILEIGLEGADRVTTSWVDVRPIPSADSWFETVWNDFLRDRIIR